MRVQLAVPSSLDCLGRLTLGFRVIRQKSGKQVAGTVAWGFGPALALPASADCTSIHVGGPLPRLAPVSLARCLQRKVNTGGNVRNNLGQ